MLLPPEEPAFGPWTAMPATSLLESWRAKLPAPGLRPGVVAVDGRGGSGKSTFAAALARAVPGAAVVHTDDLAWHHAFFDWANLLRDGVLVPVHAGQAVQYRPPAWDARGREGAVVVPAGCPLLVVEGSGAARRELMPWTDVVVWVQTDTGQAKARAMVRDGGTPEALTFWDEWMAEEFPFFARERPWERADTVATGAPGVAHDPAEQVVVSAGR
ncbi:MULTISPECIES: uridine kinase family protein [Deinococcus]|uniref:Uridine kinase n=1 Tax=Deinococcus rufus TaxID=2136097 RepID=A0ABV7ZEY2_9DEIO|nr:hypothetical protein [Deinococcus sp. AB2017081]WQE96810.1 hypothetical protein U2P90_07890 [Deinococcus sp. AB2017081]